MTAETRKTLGKPTCSPSGPMAIEQPSPSSLLELDGASAFVEVGTAEPDGAGVGLGSVAVGVASPTHSQTSGCGMPRPGKAPSTRHGRESQIPSHPPTGVGHTAHMPRVANHNANAPA